MSPKIYKNTKAILFFFFPSFLFKTNSCQNCGCQIWQLRNFPILAKELIWDMQITLFQKLSKGSQGAQLRLDTSFITLWSHCIFQSPRNKKQGIKTKRCHFSQWLHRVAITLQCKRVWLSLSEYASNLIFHVYILPLRLPNVEKLLLNFKAKKLRHKNENKQKKKPTLYNKHKFYGSILLFVMGNEISQTIYFNKIKWRKASVLDSFVRHLSNLKTPGKKYLWLIYSSGLLSDKLLCLLL